MRRMTTTPFMALIEGPDIKAIKNKRLMPLPNGLVARVARLCHNAALSSPGQSGLPWQR